MKAPKKPAKSASEQSWKRYDERKTAYDKANANKARLIKKHSK